jgi:hypothetical protein
MSDKNSNKKTENAGQKEQKNEKVMTKYDLKMERRKKEKEKQKKEEKLSMAVGIAVVVILVAFVASFPIRNFIATHETYIKINGENITRVEYDYNYNLSKTSYINQYGTYMTYFGVDFDSDLSTQMYSDELTWKDYFDQYAVDNMKQNKALLAEAEAEGFTYDTTEEYAEYESNLKALASSAGTTVNKYVKEQYGSYATLSRISEYIKESMVINAFYAQKTEEMAPTDDEIESYYQENKDTYDSVDYRISTFGAELPTEPTELADEEPVYTDDGTYTPSEAEVNKAMTDARELAYEAEMTITSDGEEILGTKRSGVTSTDARDWLFDSSRKAGDTTVIEDEDSYCYYVIAFENRYLDDTATVNARILITDADGSETLLDTWSAGEATEESFAALCDENTLDTSVEGGLYEDLSESSMDEDLAAWLFDSSRQYGDTTCITGYDGYTYIMYYLNEGEPQWKAAIISNLTSSNMSSYVEEISDAVIVEDPKGNLNYLKVQAETDDADETTDENASTEASAETTAQ